MFINIKLDGGWLSFRRQLCDLFESNSTFLHPQLENIVKSLPFPTDNITETRWGKILHKATEVHQETYHGKFASAFLKLTWFSLSIEKYSGKNYIYAEDIALRLSDELENIRNELEERKSVNITLP